MFFYQEICDGDSKSNFDFVENHLFFIVLSYSKDKVSNVRTLAGGVLKKLRNFLKNKDNIEKCKIQIEELKKDKDIDVALSVD